MSRPQVTLAEIMAMPEGIGCWHPGCKRQWTQLVIGVPPGGRVSTCDRHEQEARLAIEGAGHKVDHKLAGHLHAVAGARSNAAALDPAYQHFSETVDEGD